MYMARITVCMNDVIYCIMSSFFNAVFGESTPKKRAFWEGAATKSAEFRLMQGVPSGMISHHERIRCGVQAFSEWIVEADEEHLLLLAFLLHQVAGEVNAAEVLFDGF